MVELANEKVAESDIKQLIDSLFAKGGLENKTAITFTDFRKILKDYESELSCSSLNLQGDSPDFHPT